MLKKTISLVLCCVMLLLQGMSAVQASAENEPDIDELYTSLLPSDDGYIRRDRPDENFGAVTTISADVREGSRRYPLMRFDASKMKTSVDTASKVVLSFCVRKEMYYSRFLVYPLYGAHRNFDENTLTWSIASSIMENGVSLADYLDSPYPQKEQPTDGNWQYYELDVTDYVKAQNDYIYAFKFWGTPGTENYVHLFSKEKAGFEPCLKFYTEVDYILEKAAKETLLSIPLRAVTESFVLPPEWTNSDYLQEACTIEWESADENVLRIEERDGVVMAVVGERPKNADSSVALTMRIRYRGNEKEQTAEVLILCHGKVPLTGDTYTTGATYSAQVHGGEHNLIVGNVGIGELERKIYVSFSALTSEERLNAQKILLRIYPDNSKTVQKGTVHVSRVTNAPEGVEELTGDAAASLEVSQDYAEAYFEHEYAVDIDVTDIIDRDTENTFVLQSNDDEVDFYSQEGGYPAQLVVMDAAETELYDTLIRAKEEFLSQRAETDENFTLPENMDGCALTWESGDETLIQINNGYAEITRPSYEDGDKSAAISLVVSAGTVGVGTQFLVAVKRQDPDGVNGRRKLKDPMHLSDEDFFGKWSDTLGSYEKAPVLQYNTIPELSEVEYYARRGAYEQAKEELLAYWRGRDPKLNYEVKPTDKRSTKTRLATEYIIGNQTPLSTFSIGSELGWYEVKLSNSDRVRQAYMIFDRSKDGSTGVIYSQNSDYAPYIKVVCGSDTIILPCSADTYMEGAENSENVNGRDVLLLTHEAGNPFNSDAKRIYLNFSDEDIASIEGKGDVKSVSLMVYGRKMCGSSGDMQLVVYDAPLATYLDEDTAKWSDITPGTFNFNDCIYDWSAPYGSEAEWINSIARQEDDVNMVSYYLGTGDETSAAVALENIIGIYTYQEPGFPRALDTGWRTPALLATTFGLIDSEYMTPEVFCALIKYAYQMLSFLDTASTPSVVNQINAVDTGLTRLVVYYPEIHDTSYYEKSRKRHDQLYGKMLHDDGAYREATTGYIHRVISEMKEVIEMYEKIGYTDTDKWKTRAHMLATYYANSFFPDGELVPYGDAGRVKYSDLLWEFGEFFDDDMLRYQSRREETQTPQEYLSRLFPQKQIAIMRDGWSKNAMYATITAETGHSHGHPDDLHMDIYAYGRPLLIDAGNGGGYNPILPAAVVRTETYPHNTVEINGKPQSYDVGTNGLSMTANESFDRTVGFAETNVGYRHTRKVFFKHGGFWIVSDIIKPEDASKSSVYRQNWHPDNMANLEVDASTGKAQTHFAGTANLTILQADGAASQAEVKQSFIKDEQLVNRLEDYVSYKKEASGTVVYNTLLFPTEAGMNEEVSFAQIQLDNAASEIASAMLLNYRDKQAVYYYSNEETPSERQFGDYQFDGEMAYVETKSDGAVSYIAMTNGSKLMNKDGDTLLAASVPISDIAVQKIGSTLQVTTSGKLSSDIKIRPYGNVTAITLNGTARDVEWEDGMLVLHAEKTVLPICVDGTKMSYTFTEDYVKDLALTHNGTTKKVTVTIPKGTKVSAALGWDGQIDFSVNERDQLTVRLDANQPLSFDNMVTIEVHFYSSSGAYYKNNSVRRSYGDGNATVKGHSDGSTVSTLLGGEFIFTRLIGALPASGSTGKGGGGSVVKPTAQPSAEPTASPKPDTDPGQKGAFKDISGHWAEQEINALAEKGILSGDGNGSFRPDDVLTRAEFVKMLVTLLAEPTDYQGGFADVQSGAWYAPFVQTAVSKGIAGGYADGLFRPEGAVTREEAAKMLMMAFPGDEQAEESILLQFSDSRELAEWAASYMAQAVQRGIFKGTDDGKIEPKAKLTRAMAAAVLYRLLAAGQTK